MWVECQKMDVQGSTASHPFANFRVNYLLNLRAEAGAWRKTTWRK
jgi:hypothetical protein